MVMVLIVVAAWPILKVWFAAEAIVAVPMAIVLESVAEVPPSFWVSSSKLSAASAVVKLVKLRPETVKESLVAKLAVTLRTRVALLSS